MFHSKKASSRRDLYSLSPLCIFALIIPATRPKDTSPPSLCYFSLAHEHIRHPMASQNPHIADPQVFKKTSEALTQDIYNPKCSKSQTDKVLSTPASSSNGAGNVCQPKLSIEGLCTGLREQQGYGNSETKDITTQLLNSSINQTKP